MNKSSLRGVRFSFVALGVSVVALIISLVLVPVLAAWRERQQTPRLAVNSLVKALKTHHKQTERFPEDFRELETRVWKHKKPPDFGPDGRTLSLFNYSYCYQLIDANQAAVWIIPTGPYRQKASTHFILINPNSMRRWKGPALSLNQIRNLPPVPQYTQIAEFGMTEQSPIDLSRGR